MRSGTDVGVGSTFGFRALATDGLFGFAGNSAVRTTRYANRKLRIVMCLRCKRADTESVKC